MTDRSNPVEGITTSTGLESLEMGHCEPTSGSSALTSMVLVMRPEPTDKWLIKDFLQKQGWLVLKPDPEKLFEQKAEKFPDLLLMDTHSAKAIGNRLAEVINIKKDIQICAILIDHDQDAKPWLDMGFDDSIQMPVSVSSLQARVEMYKRLIKHGKDATHYTWRLWHSTFESIDQAVMVVDKNFRIRAANAAQCLLSNSSKKKLEGARCWQSFEHHRMAGHDGCPLKKILAQKKAEHLSAEITIADREYRVSCMPVIDSAGQLDSVIHVTKDITEEKIAQTRLQQMDKMEALGRLAGGVAHDFNNLLMVIQTHAEMLSEKTESSDPINADIDPIRHAAQRCAALTEQLLSFSRQPSEETKTTEPNSCIRDLEPIFRSIHGQGIRIHLELQESLPAIICDKTQLEQVLMNLVVNAKDAIDGRGEIVIQTSSLVSSNEARPMVEISVKDSGCGMDDQTASRILEPFFTTKPPGKGTGLGLSTVHNIVRQHNGNLDITTSPGQGTKICVRFPASDHPSSDHPPLPTETISYRGSGQTILLAEDEYAVLALTSHILSDLAYRVIEAQDGQQALQMAAKTKTPIDLLLTDVAMPVMGGVELAQKLKQQYPELPVLFMSGYLQDDLDDMGLDLSKYRLLSKPINKFTLAREITNALALEKPSIKPERARLQVIIIDDDELLRKAFARTLNTVCDVTALKNLAELEQVTASGHVPDVILCDMHLEKASSENIISWFDMRPSLRSHTLFITGGIFDKNEQKAIDISGIPLLYKPLSRDELLRRVREMADKNSR